MSCTLFVDTISDSEWSSCAQEFSDYSIYQTQPYQQVRAELDHQEISRLVVKDNSNQPILMCHVRIKQIPFTGIRVGYAQWGPLILGKNGRLRSTSEAISEFCRYYLQKRVDILRVAPHISGHETGTIADEMFTNSGFVRSRSSPPYHTMYLSLDQSEAKLREGLHQSWRRKLKKSESQPIEVVESVEDNHFRIAEDLYRKMQSKKGFSGLDLRQFIQAQPLLFEKEKMKVIVAYYQQEPVTALISSYLGDTGLLLVVASSNIGLTCNSSYQVWWQSIMNARQVGMKRYDMGGIDFVHVLNVSRFKAGIGGEEASHIGVYDAFRNKTLYPLWECADRMRQTKRRRNLRRSNERMS